MSGRKRSLSQAGGRCRLQGDPEVARALARLKSVNGNRVRTVETYDEAEPNELVALVGSSGRIEFALRANSAAARLHSAPGESLLVT